MKKMHENRRLLVLAVNELLKQKCITLDYNGDDKVAESECGHIRTVLAGFESVILWRNIGYGELSISIWWNYDHSKHPQAELDGSKRENFTSNTPLAKKSKYSDFVGAVVSGHLERKDGKYLMGKNTNFLTRTYLRQNMSDSLKNLEIPDPDGYSSEGKMHF